MCRYMFAVRLWLQTNQVGGNTLAASHVRSQIDFVSQVERWLGRAAWPQGTIAVCHGEPCGYGLWLGRSETGAAAL